MDKYFKNIKKAINDGWDFKNVRNGFRWLSFNFNYCTIKVSKDFGSFERKKLSGIEILFLRIKNKLIFIRNYIDLQKWKDALEDSEIISRMITENLDSIPSAKNQVNHKEILNSTPSSENQVKHKEDQLIEDDIIIYGLKELYKAIYKDHKLNTKCKKGLSANILNKINEKLK